MASAESKDPSLSTHVLNTALGTPGRGMKMRLESFDATAKTWSPVSSHVTNNDGRVKDIPKIQEGTYRYVMFVYIYSYLLTPVLRESFLCSLNTDSVSVCRSVSVYCCSFIFEVEDYFKAMNQECFYPDCVVSFKVKPGQHYHVPLLISPYGFSTYRGS
jgi:5-hydroxyisourate hydrolase